MKATGMTLCLVLTVLASSAQDPRLTDKWKTLFETIDFSSALDVEDHKYEEGRFYTGLVIFAHPDSVARECDIRFFNFAEFCDPSKKLEARGNKSFRKADVFCFVFDGHIFVRQSYKRFIAGEPAWARVLVNGPLRVMEHYTKGGYSGRDYTILKPISRYGNYANVSVESAGIGFCKVAERLMSESGEIVSRICAKEEGYRPKNFMQIIKEFNAYISRTDTGSYSKSISPYFYFVEPAEK